MVSSISATPGAQAKQAISVQEKAFFDARPLQVQSSFGDLCEEAGGCSRARRHDCLEGSSLRSPTPEDMGGRTCAGVGQYRFEVRTAEIRFAFRVEEEQAQSKTLGSLRQEARLCEYSDEHEEDAAHGHFAGCGEEDAPERPEIMGE